jgi:hypothetical protein
MHEDVLGVEGPTRLFKWLYGDGGETMIMGRRGWHMERISFSGSEPVLILGGIHIS